MSYIYFPGPVNTSIVKVPEYTSFSLQKETMDKVMEFLKKHSELSEPVIQKVNEAILGVIEQETYEAGIREYWASRKK